MKFANQDKVQLTSLFDIIMNSCSGRGRLEQSGELSIRNPVIQVGLAEEDFHVRGKILYTIFLSNNERAPHQLAEK